MRHIIKTGNFQSGVRLLAEKGGQLFPQRNSDSPTVHICGGVATTFWPENSAIRGRVTTLAKSIGYDPEEATGGRIARYITNNIARVPYEDTYFNHNLLKLARGGKHWHYLYARPGLYDYGVEIDLKSAYWASFCSGKTSLLAQDYRWLDDSDALENLRILMKSLPKWLRVSLLGCWSAHRHQFYVRDKSSSEPYAMVLKSRSEVKYGALFSASHRAILRVYQCMKEIHSFLGDDCLRIHTDGVIINCSNGMDFEAGLEDIIRRWGFEYTVKGFGHCWVSDVNSHVLGKKIAGSKRAIRDELLDNEIKLEYNREPPCSHRWFDELPATERADIDMHPVPIVSQTTIPGLLY
jgi:hypothetical protein